MIIIGYVLGAAPLLITSTILMIIPFILVDLTVHPS